MVAVSGNIRNGTEVLPCAEGQWVRLCVGTPYHHDNALLIYAGVSSSQANLGILAGEDRLNAPNDLAGPQAVAQHHDRALLEIA